MKIIKKYYDRIKTLSISFLLVIIFANTGVFLFKNELYILSYICFIFCIIVLWWLYSHIPNELKGRSSKGSILFLNSQNTKAIILVRTQDLLHWNIYMVTELENKTQPVDIIKDGDAITYSWDLKNIDDKLKILLNIRPLTNYQALKFCQLLWKEPRRFNSEDVVKLIIKSQKNKFYHKILSPTLLKIGEIGKKTLFLVIVYKFL